MAPGTNRLLLVTTPDWNAVDGTLQRYERRGNGWEKVGDRFAIVVGKNGLAWDPALLSKQTQRREGPMKHEGDGRSPAGLFYVGETFGFADQAPTARKYIPLTAAIECVDDVNSMYYAHIVDRNSVPRLDWNSSEKMRDIDVYKLGMLVNYNVSGTVRGNGSCIFLHIWKGPGRGTAGCTAMEEARLQELVRWIGDQRTVLVQLPVTEYEHLKQDWKLP